METLAHYKYSTYVGKDHKELDNRIENRIKQYDSRDVKPWKYVDK